MAGYIVMGTLAAFGALCLGWLLLGWLLPSGEGCAVVCFGEPDEGILSRYLWLRNMGFLHCPMLAVAEDPGQREGSVEYCGGEQLLLRLELERNHGTGTGDPPGRHRRRGVSEL